MVFLRHNRLTILKEFGAPERSRGPNPQNRSLMLLKSLWRPHKGLLGTARSATQSGCRGSLQRCGGKLDREASWRA